MPYSSPFYTSSTPGAQHEEVDHPRTRNAASRTLPLPYTSSNSGLSLSQPGSPSADLDDLGTLTSSSTLLPVRSYQMVASAGSPAGSGDGNKEQSNNSWTMMIFNKLSGAQRRKNKKNKKVSVGSNSADGGREKENVLGNEFLFASGRGKSSYVHRPDSVVEEEITLKTLKRRDRNSSIIRKSLALDDDSFATAIAHRPGDTDSRGHGSGDTGMTSTVTSFRESGKGHHFKFTADDPAHVLWCDICGEAIFSLLYRAIRCENCGYLCHENCRPGVGLDCPAELEKQLEQRLSQVDPEKLMQQLEMPATTQTSASSSNDNQGNNENQDLEPSPPFSTPPLTPSAFNGYDSTSEHAAEEIPSVSIARDSLSRGANRNDDEEAILTPVLRRKQEKRRSQKSHFDFSSGSVGNRGGDDVMGPSERGELPSTTASSEEQVQMWALRLIRSNSLYSKSPIMYEKSLRPGTLVGSAAGPKVTNDFQLPYNLTSSSSASSGGIVATSSAAGAGTLPTKLKAKDLEKRVLEYAKQNPQSDLKLVKKNSSGSVLSSSTFVPPKEVSKSNNSLFNSLKRKGEDGVEFEGFLHVTMCLHRPISVANEVALDFSLESVHRNMSFERSKSENRTTFYLPYGSEHAVRCSSEDSTSTVVKKLLQKFHVADDPRKYVLFHDVINGQPDTPVTRRRVNENERPLYLALLFGAHKMNNNLSGGSTASGGGDHSKSADQSNSSQAKHVFVLEENEQPDIQWDRFSEHELTMFLEILKLEEEQHIAMIREKYEKEKNKLQEKLDIVSSYISANRESSPENNQEFCIEDLEKNESES